MPTTTKIPPAPDNYDLPALETALAGTIFSGRVHYFAVADSTNSLALAGAQAGDPAGSVTLADAQTAGRGRGDHRWHSPAGMGLYVSLLLRPRLPAARALLISLAAGLAAQTAVKATTGCTLDLRWPNDLMLARKKCGGILVESAVEAGGTLRHAVIGVGINVRHMELPAELAPIATSLAIESGRDHSRQPLLAALLAAIDAEMQALETATDAMELLQRFAAASTWVHGKRVHVDEAGGYTGTTTGLSPQGLLLVQTASGMRTVVSGGVREA